MKKTVFVFIALLLCLSAVAAVKLESEFDLDFSYNNNILNLSDGDQDQFENNDKPEKYQIETLDDLITNFRYKLKAKNHWLAGHTQILSFSIDYDKYLKNDMCDKMAISVDVDQYLSRDVKLNIGYSYAPEIYLRRYKSVLDDEYHDFDYSKNGYKFQIDWNMLKKLELSVRFDYSQLYYSEWFTEYDADVVSGSIYATYDLLPKLQTELRFTRRSSNASAEDAFNNPENISVIKDASFEGNIYAANIKLRKLPLKSTFNLQYKLYEKFYASDYEDDEYHYKRDDYLHTFSAGLYIPVNKELKLTLHGEYNSRTTDSLFDQVTDDKEYSTWESGLKISYDIKH